MNTVTRHAETLPSSISASDRAVLEAAGVRFGNIDPEHPLFIVVSLPEFWWIQGFEDTSSACTLDDEKGRSRALITYTFGNACFASASIELYTRYSYGEDMRHDDAHNSVKVNVGEGRNLVYATQAYRFDNRFAVEYFAALEAATTDARTWLDTNYPCWEDPSAYWD